MCRRPCGDMPLAADRSNPGRFSKIPKPFARWMQKWLSGTGRTPAGESPGRAKPANLIYSVDEDPPLPVTIVLAVQHVFVISVGWIFVVVVVTAISGTTEQSQSLIRMSMIASGLATILQALRKGPVGSGYLCPFSCGPSYLSALILAGQAGGLPLMFGMTTASGVFEGLLSRVV